MEAKSAELKRNKFQMYGLILQPCSQFFFLTEIKVYMQSDSKFQEKNTHIRGKKTEKQGQDLL